MRRTSFGLRCIAAGAVVAVCALSACSSDNDSISVSLDGEARSGAGGIYDGTLEFNTNNRRENWTLLLAEPLTGSNSARLVGLSEDDPTRIVLGQYTQRSARQVNAALRLYDIIDVTLPPEEPEAPDDPDAEPPPEPEEPVIIQQRRARPFTVDAVLNPRANLTGTFTGQNPPAPDADDPAGPQPNIGDGLIDTDYERLAYERFSSLTALAGQWTDTDSFGFSARGSFTFNEDGSISGSAFDTISETQCQYEGAVETINNRFNLYRVRMNQSNCGFPEDDTPNAQPTAFEMVGLLRLDAFQPGEGIASSGEMLMVLASDPGPNNALPVDARAFRLTRN